MFRFIFTHTQTYNERKMLIFIKSNNSFATRCLIIIFFFGFVQTQESLEKKRLKRPARIDSVAAQVRHKTNSYCYVLEKRKGRAKV